MACRYAQPWLGGCGVPTFEQLEGLRWYIKFGIRQETLGLERAPYLTIRAFAVRVVGDDCIFMARFCDVSGSSSLAFLQTLSQSQHLKHTSSWHRQHKGITKVSFRACPASERVPRDWHN